MDRIIKRINFALFKCLLLGSSTNYSNKLQTWSFSTWHTIHSNDQSMRGLAPSQFLHYFLWIILTLKSFSYVFKRESDGTGTYQRALIIPLVHVQPGFKVRRIKDDWPKAITKACKTWVFCSVWQYNYFSITLKNSPISGVHSRDQS